MAPVLSVSLSFSRHSARGFLGKFNGLTSTLTIEPDGGGKKKIPKQKVDLFFVLNANSL